MTKRWIALAVTMLSLVATGCGGDPEPEQVETVDVSGLIEVDQWNEELGVSKEEFEAAIAETLQERAPDNVKVIYNQADGGE